jgi:hypothetical protein
MNYPYIRQAAVAAVAGSMRSFSPFEEIEASTVFWGGHLPVEEKLETGPQGARGEGIERGTLLRGEFADMVGISDCRWQMQLWMRREGCRDGTARTTGREG